MTKKQKDELILKRVLISWLIVFMIGFVVGFAVGIYCFPPKTENKAIEEQSLTSIESQPEKVFLGTYKITGYCACEECCGEFAKDNSGENVYGASGKILTTNHSCASPLPFGTIVEIDGLGTYTVEDRTADWVAEENDNKIIDIYFGSHEEAFKFGCKYLDVYEVQ